ncbi:MAG: hypothetical protein OSB31_11065 [Paracoccaceae bacterium]|nr:hypothetical protein [Paracoccaceae bacterium]
MNPELRPDEAIPIDKASKSTMCLSGASSPKRRAAARPVKPAPITTMSVSMLPCRLALASLSGRLLYHPQSFS